MNESSDITDVFNDTFASDYRYDADNGAYEDVFRILQGPRWLLVSVTACCVVIFMSGVIGNLVTCTVIVTNKHMHTATNYYLSSLAISDLLILVAGLPHYMWSLWFSYPTVLGDFLCILVWYTSEVGYHSSVLTITAFTVERYVAICHPFLSRTVSSLSRAIKVIALIWVLSVCLAVPQVMQMKLVEERVDRERSISICGLKDNFSQYPIFLSSFFFFLVPMILISILYTLIGLKLLCFNEVIVEMSPSQHQEGARVKASMCRNVNDKSTKHVIKMLVAVVVAFFLCWTPFHIQRLTVVYAFHYSSPDIFTHQVTSYLSGLYCLTTTINPILYSVMSHRFRQAFKSSILQCLSCYHPHPRTSTETTESMWSRTRST